MSNRDEQATALSLGIKALARREFLKKAALAGGAALAFGQLRLSSAQAVETNGAKNAPKSSHDAGKAGMSSSASDSKDGTKKDGKMMAHPMHAYDPAEMIQARGFRNLTNVDGISQNQLAQHVELYNGYVKRINDIDTQIKAIPADVLSQANATYNPFRELHMEQTYALNGVILHEYYFENIGFDNPADAKIPPTQTEMLHKVITQEFGSWDNYIAHLVAVGKSARGWALTGYNMRDHRVHNYGLDLHNQMVPINVIPLLVLDVYEHAYMIDFGTKRAAYIDAFLRNVNWQIADHRLKTMMFHG